MHLDGIRFEFISHIVPKQDGSGQILEDRPALRYKNVKNLPLHPYGSGPFCRFNVFSPVDGIGVYSIVEDQNREVLYIGKCTGVTSTLRKRFNQGYGSIQPRNCYEGGQSTNCRINSLILDGAKNGGVLSVYYHKAQTKGATDAMEACLIGKLRPPWNKRSPSSGVDPCQ